MRYAGMPLFELQTKTPIPGIWNIFPIRMAVAMRRDLRTVTADIRRNIEYGGAK